MLNNILLPEIPELVTRIVQLRAALLGLRGLNPSQHFELWTIPAADGGWIEYHPPGDYRYTVYTTAVLCAGIIDCADGGRYPQFPKFQSRPRTAMRCVCDTERVRR